MMAEPLWSWDALVRAAGGVDDGAPTASITGFSLDSRSVEAGDVFVALADQRDGHEFVTAAFAKGAVAALVSSGYARKAGDGALLRVADTLEGLRCIGRAARARLSDEARVIAVTGSAGKTGTKEMLRACFARLGATHAPEKSFNNHWGVPLTLARMPAATRYGVFEIGMNHAGEITPLAKLVRPDVAIITNVLPVHLGHFADEDGIADAKAEIFAGLEPGGAAVLNRDNPHFARLARAAEASGARVVGFGRDPASHVRLVHGKIEADGSALVVDCAGGRITFRIGASGDHIAMNSLAVVAAIEAAAGSFEDLIHAIGALAATVAPVGRGQRAVLDFAGGRVLLIDESYNANPASMRAALEALSLTPRTEYPRRIAVLGDMLELGERSAELHVGLKDAIDAAGIDLVFAAGPLMRGLYDRIGPDRRGGWGQTSDDLAAELRARIRAGDAVMIKGSLGSRMGPLVGMLRQLEASQAGRPGAGERGRA